MQSDSERGRSLGAASLLGWRTPSLHGVSLIALEAALQTTRSRLWHEQAIGTNLKDGELLSEVNRAGVQDEWLTTLVHVSSCTYTILARHPRATSLLLIVIISPGNVLLTPLARIALCSELS